MCILCTVLHLVAKSFKEWDPVVNEECLCRHALPWPGHYQIFTLHISFRTQNFYLNFFWQILNVFYSLHLRCDVLCVYDNEITSDKGSFTP